ncbi:MAG: dephospho-CoA kinase [Pseudobdellovibrionaceae bacterium]
MKWIGLTGGLATGKSTVAQILRDLGVVVLDADQLAKDITAKGSPGLQEIATHFGTEFILPDGSLDRAKLGQHVFTHPQDLRRLESILHPRIQKQVADLKKQYSEQGEKRVIYDVPLLFEKNMQDQFDAVIVVASSEALQKQRMQQRNAWDEKHIQARLSAQKPLSEKIKAAQFVVYNDQSLEDLRLNVKQLLSKL